MCFMYFIYLVIAFTCGILLFLIYGNERDTYQSINELSWVQLILKFLRKFFQNYRQGVIKIDSSLVYLVDAGNDDFPFILSARNHKITVHGIRFWNFVLLSHWLSFVSWEGYVDFVIFKILITYNCYTKLLYSLIYGMNSILIVEIWIATKYYFSTIS